MPSQQDLERALSLITQSIALQQKGQTEEALSCLDAALLAVPNFPAALVKRGSALQALLRYEDAVADFERCLMLKSNMPHVRALRDGALQMALDNLDFETAPGLAQAQIWCKQAALLSRLQRDDAALESYRRALEVDSLHTAAWTGMGNLLLCMQRHNEALECYERILAFAPDDAVALFNRGNVLQQNGRLHEALASYDATLAISPGLPEALMEQAHCRLALGEFETGWRLFEARWGTRQLRNAKLKTAAPMWRGEMLDGDTVLLLWAEQGLGDTLQFARYLPLAAQRARNILVRVPTSLKTLIAAAAAQIVNAEIEVIGNDAQLPPHELHCPLMSLPLALGATQESDQSSDQAPIPQATHFRIPSTIPYLQAPRATADKWRTRLGTRSRPRIGMVWAGGQRWLNNPTRDMRAEQLRPLLDIGVEWIGLQQSISEADQQALQQMPPFQCVGDELTDFADTAGLIEQLDAIVSVDSSVAHLAGALGKPVCLMLRKSGEWRWQQGRSDTPWYPSHRLLRQPQHGDWDDVVRQVVQHLVAITP